MPDLVFMWEAFRSYQTILHYITYFCGLVSMAQAEFILRKKDDLWILPPQNSWAFASRCRWLLCQDTHYQASPARGNPQYGPGDGAILIFLFLLFSLPTPAGGEKTRATSIWLSPLFVPRVLWVNVVRLWRLGSGGGGGGGVGGKDGGGLL